MMSYELFVTQEVQKFIQSQDHKSQRIIKENLKKLEKNPYPGVELEIKKNCLSWEKNVTGSMSAELGPPSILYLKMKKKFGFQRFSP